MDILHAPDSDDSLPRLGTDSLSSAADESESFAIEMTTRDFLDDLGNISMGVQMNLELHTADEFRRILSGVLTVQECTASHKLPAIAFISAHDITAIDQIVDCFRALALETELTIEQLEKRARILIRSFDLLLKELRVEYVQ